jgi:prolyl-tRNA synthetase
VAPFKAGLINMRPADPAVSGAADAIYGKLAAAGIATLMDDSEESAGAKFAQMDLIGLPWQVIVGPRGVKNGTVEMKNRKTGERQDLSADSAVARLAGG